MYLAIADYPRGEERCDSNQGTLHLGDSPRWILLDGAVDRSVHRFEGDLLGNAGGDDPPGLLPHRGHRRPESAAADRREGKKEVSLPPEGGKQNSPGALALGAIR